MKFILSQELSRHNRDKKCNPMEQQIDYKTYEISYETIEILPTYTIITPLESVTTHQSSDVNTNTSGSSGIFLIPPVPLVNRNEFEIQGLTRDPENVNAEDVGTVKSWNCGLCVFK